MTAQTTPTAATTISGAVASAGICASMGGVTSVTVNLILTVSGPMTLMSTAASILGGRVVPQTDMVMDTAVKVGSCPSHLPVTPQWGRGATTPTNTASTLVASPTTPAPTPAFPGRRCVRASAGVREIIRCVAPT